MYLDIVLEIIGGIGIFLYGIDKMSKGMESIAGERLKKTLSLLTTNRFISIFFGIFITALVQSSSATTVMAVGFVNASLLTIKQALGIILGARIGSTITGWIIALKIGKYGLPITGLAIMSKIIFTSEKAKKVATTVIGFGLLFFGLEIMSKGVAPLKTTPEFIKLFQLFTADSYSGVLKAAGIGALLTAIIQSSSATLGITISLASQGLLDYPTAVAIGLGGNIGTTITAFIASINSTKKAKMVAYAHIMISLVGLIWATTLFKYFILFIAKIINPERDIITAIAMAATVFNVINVCLFIPFVGYLSEFLYKIEKSNES